MKILDPRRDPRAIARAARILRRGGLVAFPTETVYGLGADALDPRAVRRIFRAKGRPPRNPLIVHVASVRQAESLAAALPPAARRLMRRFWPGPLTIVLPKSDRVPSVVTAGLRTVALRMPAHPAARALLRAAGVPVAAPSANRSGRPSPTTAAHVVADLGPRVDAVLDGGPARVGLESTVVDLSGPEPRVLRPGAVTPAQIARVLGRRVGRTLRSARSPGMRYRHYAPRTPVVVAEGAGKIRNLLRNGGRIGVVLTRSSKSARFEKSIGRRSGPGPFAEASGARRSSEGRRRGGPSHSRILVVRLGPSLANVARRLYATLRDLDARGLDRIVVEAVPERGIGVAIMNRLRKAAGR